MKVNLAFRSWFYFRVGYSTYLSFVLAAINTLVTTYYLAIEKAPALKAIFPSFAIYVLVATAIGIPILILIGYVHYKRSKAFHAEIDVQVEANPYSRRTIVNADIILELMMKSIELNLKFSKNEKLTEDEIKEISDLHKSYVDFINSRTFSNDGDMKYIQKKIKNL